MRTTIPELTRKDFKYIARIISELPVDPEQKKKIAIHFADRLRYTNQAFKHATFIEASTIETEDKI
jgi:hypothetical protein